MDMKSALTNDGDLMIVQSVQDVEPILNSCKEKRDMGATGSGELKHAANFPMVLIETYLNKFGVTYQEFIQNNVHIKRMLNDPDLKGFRVWQGAV